MKSSRSISLVLAGLVLVAQVLMAAGVDTSAAYMTVFGRTATAAEISYWQNRLPATQDELVQINVNWLVSPSGARDLSETVQRGFQQVFSRQPSAAEQQEWEGKIKQSRMVFADFVGALKPVLLNPVFIAKQVQLGSAVDISAAYMTVFGRPATPAEMDYWQSRKPASQGELIDINIKWLISPSGAKDLSETVVRAYKEVNGSGNAPAADEQAKWEGRVKTSKWVYAELVSAMHNVPQEKLPPAFPATSTQPVVLSCPIVALAPKSNRSDSVPLTRTAARYSKGTLACDYTLVNDMTLSSTGACSDTMVGTVVVGPTPGTTTLTQEGCNMGSAWCYGEANYYSGKLKAPSSYSCTYSGGSVSLQHTTQYTCWGGPGVADGNSANGQFLCW